MQEMSFIAEGDVYRLITHSKLPEAQQFEKWLFDEMLPSLRKDGMYIAGQEQMSDDEFIAQALIRANTIIKRRNAELSVANETIQEQQQRITDMKPKAEFYDDVTDSKDAKQMSEIAKVLDMGVGRNRLFEILREEKILQADNIPYQKYIDCGYFRVIEQKYLKANGEIAINIKTLVYQKGADYIRKLLRERFKRTA